jgi:hypothetical protein
VLKLVGADFGGFLAQVTSVPQNAELAAPLLGAFAPSESTSVDAKTKDPKSTLAVIANRLVRVYKLPPKFSRMTLVVVRQLRGTNGSGAQWSFIRHHDPFPARV